MLAMYLEPLSHFLIFQKKNLPNHINSELYVVLELQSFQNATFSDIKISQILIVRIEVILNLTHIPVSFIDSFLKENVLYVITELKPK